MYHDSQSGQHWWSHRSSVLSIVTSAEAEVKMLKNENYRVTEQ